MHTFDIEENNKIVYGDTFVDIKHMQIGGIEKSHNGTKNSTSYIWRYYGSLLKIGKVVSKL